MLGILISDEKNLSVSFLNWELGYGTDRPTSTVIEVISENEANNFDLIRNDLISLCRSKEADVEEIVYKKKD